MGVGGHERIVALRKKKAKVLAIDGVQITDCNAMSVAGFRNGAFTILQFSLLFRQQGCSSRTLIGALAQLIHLGRQSIVIALNFLQGATRLLQLPPIAFKACLCIGNIFFRLSEGFAGFIHSILISNELIGGVDNSRCEGEPDIRFLKRRHLTLDKPDGLANLAE